VGIGLFLASVTGKPFGNWEPLVITALSACVLATWLVLAGPKRKAVLWEGGLIIIGRHRRPESIAWNAIERIHVDRDDERIEFSGALDEDLLTLELDFFSSEAKADRFVAEARKWWESRSSDDAAL
jgi:hypothetical protein